MLLYILHVWLLILFLKKNLLKSSKTGFYILNFGIPIDRRFWNSLVKGNGGLEKGGSFEIVNLKQ